MNEETTPAVEETTLPQEGGDKQSSELERARREAARYRTELRDLQNKWKEAEPVLTQFQQQQEAQKTAEQKLTERVQAAEQAAAQARVEADEAKRSAQIARLAMRANVADDVLALLDTSKIPVEDEEKALAMLGKLAQATRPAANASNPGRAGQPGQPTDEELRQYYFGGGRNKPTIFGGN